MLPKLAVLTNFGEVCKEKSNVFSERSWGTIDPGPFSSVFLEATFIPYYGKYINFVLFYI